MLDHQKMFYPVVLLVVSKTKTIKVGWYNEVLMGFQLQIYILGLLNIQN